MSNLNIPTNLVERKPESYHDQIAVYKNLLLVTDEIDECLGTGSMPLYVAFDGNIYLIIVGPELVGELPPRHTVRALTRHFAQTCQDVVEDALRSINVIPEEAEFTNIATERY